jgi:hypothetical protein
VGQRGHLGQHLRYRCLDRRRSDGARLGLQHDLVGVTGHGGEVLLQQAQRSGRLGVGQLELAREIGLGRGADAAHDDQGGQPEHQDQPAVLEAPSTENGHGGTSALSGCQGFQGRMDLRASGDEP